MPPGGTMLGRKGVASRGRQAPSTDMTTAPMNVAHRAQIDAYAVARHRVRSSRSRRHDVGWVTAAGASIRIPKNASRRTRSAQPKSSANHKVGTRISAPTKARGRVDTPVTTSTATPTATRPTGRSSTRKTTCHHPARHRDRGVDGGEERPATAPT